MRLECVLLELFGRWSGEHGVPVPLLVLPSQGVVLPVADLMAFAAIGDRHSVSGYWLECAVVSEE